MKFNRSYILILSLFGILLLYSYYYFLKDNNNALKLWGSIKGNLLNIYYLSMILSLIGFILLFFYLLYSDNFLKNDILKIFTLLLMIILTSILWTPLSLEYLRTKNNIYKYFTLFVLFLVALSTFLLLIVLYNINDTKYILSKNLALGGMSYFFIHVFLFDFIIWSYNFFS
jgi:hypothetical protein